MADGKYRLAWIDGEPTRFQLVDPTTTAGIARTQLDEGLAVADLVAAP